VSPTRESVSKLHRMGIARSSSQLSILKVRRPNAFYMDTVEIGKNDDMLFEYFSNICGQI